MKAARILQFGPPSVITNGDRPQPEAAAEQLLVRVNQSPWTRRRAGLPVTVAAVRAESRGQVETKMQRRF
jgi:hypothetical protein